mmetsp:Transcript_11867/g.40893  ORF Transcript_11867/g.40893 Transcript_11867/m.40893 type:complete len:241 (+) Transcript_11867:1935-2657(+)
MRQSLEQVREVGSQELLRRMLAEVDGSSSSMHADSHARLLCGVHSADEGREDRVMELLLDGGAEVRAQLPNAVDGDPSDPHEVVAKQRSYKPDDSRQVFLHHLVASFPDLRDAVERTHPVPPVLVCDEVRDEGECSWQHLCPSYRHRQSVEGLKTLLEEALQLLIHIVLVLPPVPSFEVDLCVQPLDDEDERHSYDVLEQVLRRLDHGWRLLRELDKELEGETTSSRLEVPVHGDVLKHG